MNRFPTLIKGTTRGEELSFKLLFVAIGPLVLALRRVQTDGQTDGQTDRRTILVSASSARPKDYVSGNP